jgi:secretion/DNA translocation related TadE-like protein
VIHSGRIAEDRGSATVLVLGFAAMVVGLALIGTARTTAVLARHRLERAADLTALAAADQIGRSGDVCSAAARIAAANHANLSDCTVSLDASGRSGTVSIAVEQTVQLLFAGGRTANANARAARLPP